MSEQMLEKCPRCGCDEMFVRKDFPQKLGLTLVILAAVAFLILAAWRETFWIGATILAIAAAIDALLYALVAKITVCYRCGGEFPGPINPKHGGYDLSTGEKYRGGS
ncbi:MAG TPA: hypothetical protein VGF52_02260 [Tepidisphaeraceae bacterium]